MKFKSVKELAALCGMERLRKNKMFTLREVSFIAHHARAEAFEAAARIADSSAAMARLVGDFASLRCAGSIAQDIRALATTAKEGT